MISLGDTFETAVLKQLGVDPATVEPGSVTIPLINGSGKTTVMYTVSASIDTKTLADLIESAAGPYQAASSSSTAATSASVGVQVSAALKS